MQDNSPKMNATAPTRQVMSENAFALWGVEDVAYIKKVARQGETAWAIFSADGTALGTTPDRALAFAAAIQSDRLALSAH